MKYILSIAIITFAIFYSITEYKKMTPKDSQNVILVKEYINAHTYRNYNKLEKLILDKKDITSAKFTIVDFSDYTIISETDNSVKISFKRFCYDDPKIDIIIKNGKIDFNKTLRNIISESKNAIKNKVYCYEFKDQHLEGTLNGNTFIFNNYFNDKIINKYGDTKNLKLLFSEICDYVTFNKCVKSIIDLSNLRIDGNGGNFSLSNYINIINPTNDFNYIVSDGSYRITDEYNRFKIEISFNLDIENNINGFFYIDKM